MNAVAIRKMIKADWKTYQELNVEVFEHDKDHIDDLDMKWPYSEIGIAYYKKISSGTENCVGFIAELGGKSVGYIAIREKHVGYRTKSYVEIENMGVKNEYRSQGIGTRLLEIAQEWSKEKGVGVLHVSAFARNTKAITFYKKFGFVELSLDLEKEI